MARTKRKFGKKKTISASFKRFKEHEFWKFGKYYVPIVKSIPGQSTDLNGIESSFTIYGRDGFDKREISLKHWIKPNSSMTQTLVNNIRRTLTKYTDMLFYSKSGNPSSKKVRSRRIADIIVYEIDRYNRTLGKQPSGVNNANVILPKNSPPFNETADTDRFSDISDAFTEDDSNTSSNVSTNQQNPSTTKNKSLLMDSVNTIDVPEDVKSDIELQMDIDAICASSPEPTEELTIGHRNKIDHRNTIGRRVALRRATRKNAAFTQVHNASPTLVSEEARNENTSDLNENTPNLNENTPNLNENISDLNTPNLNENTPNLNENTSGLNTPNLNKNTSDLNENAPNLNEYSPNLNCVPIIEVITVNDSKLVDDPLEIINSTPQESTSVRGLITESKVPSSVVNDANIILGDTEPEISGDEDEIQVVEVPPKAFECIDLDDSSSNEARPVKKRLSKKKRNKAAKTINIDEMVQMLKKNEERKRNNYWTKMSKLLKENNKKFGSSSTSTPECLLTRTAVNFIPLVQQLNVSGATKSADSNSATNSECANQPGPWRFDVEPSVSNWEDNSRSTFVSKKRKRQQQRQPGTLRVTTVGPERLVEKIPPLMHPAGASEGITMPGNIYPEICLEERTLREIIIDGQNVGWGHGNQKEFSVKGIMICVEYFLKRGHKVKVFVPEHVRCRDQNRVLSQLERQGVVVFTPSRVVNRIQITPYDDRYILEYASRVKGVVVSRDQFRDLVGERPEFAETVNERLLMYTFVDDVLMFPIDPLGLVGPNLDVFLRLTSREMWQNFEEQRANGTVVYPQTV